MTTLEVIIALFEKFRMNMNPGFLTQEAIREYGELGQKCWKFAGREDQAIEECLDVNPGLFQRHDDPRAELCEYHYLQMPFVRWNNDVAKEVIRQSDPNRPRPVPLANATNILHENPGQAMHLNDIFVKHVKRGYWGTIKNPMHQNRSNFTGFLRDRKVERIAGSTSEYFVRGKRKSAKPKMMTTKKVVDALFDHFQMPLSIAILVQEAVWMYEKRGLWKCEGSRWRAVMECLINNTEYTRMQHPNNRELRPFEHEKYANSGDYDCKCIEAKIKEYDPERQSLLSYRNPDHLILAFRARPDEFLKKEDVFEHLVVHGHFSSHRNGAYETRRPLIELCENRGLIERLPSDTDVKTATYRLCNEVGDNPVPKSAPVIEVPEVLPELQDIAFYDHTDIKEWMKTVLKGKPKRYPVPAKIKRQKWEAQKRRCNGCNRPLDFEDLQGDHILSIAMCGKTINDPDNCQVLCQSCNTKKGERSMSEFMEDPDWQVKLIEARLREELEKEYADHVPKPEHDELVSEAFRSGLEGRRKGKHS